jgi:hypothetical protein
VKKKMGERLKKIPELPELNVLIFSALLNFPWELWQIPFFRGMADVPHWRGVFECTRAAAGDAVISLVCYSIVCVLYEDRRWFTRTTRAQIATFVTAGVLITAVSELLSVRVFGRWAYSALMPEIGGIGLLPLLQWLLIPPAVICLVRRQLR